MVFRLKEDYKNRIKTELVKELEIIVIDEKGDYNQAKWMKQLAMIAKNRLKAD